MTTDQSLPREHPTTEDVAAVPEPTRKRKKEMTRRTKVLLISEKQWKTKTTMNTNNTSPDLRENQSALFQEHDPHAIKLHILPDYGVGLLLSDKTSCTVGFVKCFSPPSLALQYVTRQKNWYTKGTVRKQFPNLTVQFILSLSTTLLTGRNDVKEWKRRNDPKLSKKVAKKCALVGVCLHKFLHTLSSILKSM